MRTTPLMPLFAPGNRPELFSKAAAASDSVILDLEDAVAADDKTNARNNVASHALAGTHVCVRINAAETPWFEDDLRMVGGGRFQSIMLPKCEGRDQAGYVRSRVDPDVAVIALVESARGIAGLAAMLEQGTPIDQVAFGSIDYALDLGCEHEWDALLLARGSIVLYSRAAGLAAPLDGVTQSIADQEAVRRDAQRACLMGFGGKLLIHPAQAAPAAEGFLPSAEKAEWAHKVLAAAAGENALQLDGMMIDRPVILRAQRMVARLSAEARSSHAATKSYA